VYHEVIFNRFLKLFFCIIYSIWLLFEMYTSFVFIRCLEIYLGQKLIKKKLLLLLQFLIPVPYSTV